MITGWNNKIGVKPIEIKEIKIEVRNGVGFMTQKNQLTAMEVVFGNEKIHVGDTVYFLGGIVAHKWFKEPIEVDGQIVCICPIDQIEFVKFGTGWDDPLGNR